MSDQEYKKWSDEDWDAFYQDKVEAETADLEAYLSNEPGMTHDELEACEEDWAELEAEAHFKQSTKPSIKPPGLEGVEQGMREGGIIGGALGLLAGGIIGAPVGWALGSLGGALAGTETGRNFLDEDRDGTVLDDVAGTIGQVGPAILGGSLGLINPVYGIAGAGAGVAIKNSSSKMYHQAGDFIADLAGTRLEPQMAPFGAEGIKDDYYTLDPSIPGGVRRGSQYPQDKGLGLGSKLNKWLFE